MFPTHPPDRVLVSLWPVRDNIARGKSTRFAPRHICLSRAIPSFPIGRSSKVETKGFVPAKANAWFNTPVMSRSHAVVMVNMDEQKVEVRDMGSTHGTFVFQANNGIPNATELRPLPPHDPRELSDGDMVTFGTSVYHGGDYLPITARVGIDWTISARDPARLSAATISVPDDASDSESEGDCTSVQEVPPPKAPPASKTSVHSPPATCRLVGSPLIDLTRADRIISHHISSEVIDLSSPPSSPRQPGGDRSISKMISQDHQLVPIGKEPCEAEDAGTHDEAAPVSAIIDGGVQIAPVGKEDDQVDENTDEAQPEEEEEEEEEEEGDIFGEMEVSEILPQNCEPSPATSAISGSARSVSPVVSLGLDSIDLSGPSDEENMLMHDTEASDSDISERITSDLDDAPASDDESNEDGDSDIEAALAYEPEYSSEEEMYSEADEPVQNDAVMDASPVMKAPPVCSATAHAETAGQTTSPHHVQGSCLSILRLLNSSRPSQSPGVEPLAAATALAALTEMAGRAATPSTLDIAPTIAETMPGSAMLVGTIVPAPSPTASAEALSTLASTAPLAERAPSPSDVAMSKGTRPPGAKYEKEQYFMARKENKDTFRKATELRTTQGLQHSSNIQDLINHDTEDLQSQTPYGGAWAKSLLAGNFLSSPVVSLQQPSMPERTSPPADVMESVFVSNHKNTAEADGTAGVNQVARRTQVISDVVESGRPIASSVSPPAKRKADDISTVTHEEASWVGQKEAQLNTSSTPIPNSVEESEHVQTISRPSEPGVASEAPVLSASNTEPAAVLMAAHDALTMATPCTSVAVSMEAERPAKRLRRWAGTVAYSALVAAVGSVVTGVVLVNTAPTFS